MADAVRRQAPPPVAGITRVPPWAWVVLALFFAMHALDDGRRLADGVGAAAGQGGAGAGGVGGRMARRRCCSSAPPWPARRPATSSTGCVGRGCWPSRFAVWSLAVVATGLTRSYDQIQAARAIAGAGGAASTVIALTLLADLFPRRMRGRVFAAYLPGDAGRGGAGTAPRRGRSRTIAGWQSAFLAAGRPGLALALLALFVPEPVRGASEPVDANRLRLHEQVGPSNEDYIDLMVNSSFNYSVFGMAFSSFALAGLVYWLPAFLAAKGMDADPAGRLSIVLLLAAAAAGTAAGGWLADTFAATRPRPAVPPARPGDVRRDRLRPGGHLRPLAGPGRLGRLPGRGRDVPRSSCRASPSSPA